jgi:hypothetical protein
MNLHAEEVRCPCFWCQRDGQEVTGHRVVRYYTDDKPLSAENQAMMDEIVKDAIRGAERRGAEHD